MGLLSAQMTSDQGTDLEAARITAAVLSDDLVSLKIRPFVCVVRHPPNLSARQASSTP